MAAAAASAALTGAAMLAPMAPPLMAPFALSFEAWGPNEPTWQTQAVAPSPEGSWLPTPTMPANCRFQDLHILIHSAGPPWIFQALGHPEQITIRANAQRALFAMSAWLLGARAASKKAVAAAEFAARGRFSAAAAAHHRPMS
jgi:hypothetical protein